MNYAEKLAGFAQQGPFTPMRVVDFEFRHSRMPVTPRHTHCDCCGTKRVTHLYPIKADGQIYLVGGNCLGRLTVMGKVNESPPFPLVQVRADGNIEELF